VPRAAPHRTGRILFACRKPLTCAND